MKVSAAVEMVWQMAGQEAIAGNFGEIEPEHFFLALLKFSELPVQEVGRIGAEGDAVKQLSQDVLRVRRTVQEAGIDSAAVRRKLREKLGKGRGTPNGGAMHRSAASWRLFEAAVGKANASLRPPDPDTPICPDALLAVLLESPTEAIKAIMGKTDRKHPAMPEPLGPLLKKYGYKLTCRTLFVEEANPAAEKVLIEFLLTEEGRSILLVMDEKDARMLIAGVSVSLHAGNNPLFRKRIVELRNLPSGTKEYEVLDLLGQILAEAAQTKNLILAVPSMTFFRQKETGDEWRKLLQQTMSHQKVQCLCPVPQDIYRHMVETDCSWKRIAHVIHVRSGVAKGIPNEL